MKRITCLILCLSLALSLCVTGAWAAETNTAPQSICTTQAWQVLKLTNKQRLANGQLPLSTFGLIQQHKKQSKATQSHGTKAHAACFYF